VAATFLRRFTVACALIMAAAALIVVAPAGPASADPEGGSKTLRNALESAAKGYVDGQTKLKASQQRQKQLQITLTQSTAGAKALQSQVAEIADRSYKMGRFSTMSMLLNSSTPDSFLERAFRLDQMAQLDAQTLTRYRSEVTLAQRAKQAIDNEVKEQAKQVTVLARKKKEAEAALGSVGGGGPAGGFVNANSPLAKAAPRNSDGSWPKESCTVNDPTTSGCITPRLLNAYQQARAAGFTHYTSCYSQRDSGEHPKGRACDFSANATTFKNAAATGSDKAYGDRLAAYFVKNADRLGVMYVIWYRQIWLPNTGWKAYSATGDPAAVHTNHVHLSVL
jgi:peptidoglycan DL-endopeptidase CwlO